MTVLSDMLSQLPMLQAALDAGFQSEVFPLLKPISFVPEDVIHHCGDVTDDLLFILDGHITLTQRTDANFTSEVDTEGEHLIIRCSYKVDPRGYYVFRTLPTHGCFGQDVFYQPRRECTARATRICTSLYISREDLLKLTSKNPRNMRRLRHVLMREVLPKLRYRRFGQAITMNHLRPGTERWAAYVVQRAWKRKEQKDYLEKLWEGVPTRTPGHCPASACQHFKRRRNRRALQPAGLASSYPPRPPSHQLYASLPAQRSCAR
jgi:CRP-like cAMP-binding protein